jgi:hypothetical protein
MENTSVGVMIGARNTTASGFFHGSLAMVLLCQKVLTADDYWAIKKLVNGYFGLSL